MRKEELIYQLDQIEGNPIIVMHIDEEYLEIKQVDSTDPRIVTLKN